VVHFLGGIHEVYFPYVLMQPLSILALVAGGVVANATFVATGAGLVATPSPGSIFAELAMAPRGGVGPVLMGIVAGALVSFATGVALVRRVGAGETTSDLIDAQARTRALKPAPLGSGTAIVFACDAGMGSSLVGAAVLQQKLREAGLSTPVTHAAISELPASTRLVVVHSSLEDRVRRQAPSAVIYAVDDFVRSPTYDRLVDALKSEVRA
jgi:PTS system mannitol-specific IIC component